MSAAPVKMCRDLEVVYPKAGSMRSMRSMRGGFISRSRHRPWTPCSPCEDVSVVILKSCHGVPEGWSSPLLFHKLLIIK